MILQQKKSNYDTDIFQPVIREIARVTGREYGKNDETNIAMRVVADHLRAITFAIADGQLPSNVGAGYVIRRILRRAVRYAYTFLGIREPFINKLVPVLINTMGDTFPEIKAQHDLIIKVITEEEFSFLRTLSQGIRKFDQYILANPKKKIIDGHFVFELFDTYGFPVDLTQLMAREKGYMVDMDGFQKGLEAQKNRSRMAASKEKDDWVILKEPGDLTKFLGYDQLENDVNIIRYRKITAQNKTCFEIIFDKTPFYPESGGQAGDTGILIFGEEKISVIDTKKENNLIIHVTTKLPHDPQKTAKAVVNKNKRELTANNHSATHLLHYALRKVLGEHVEQKGSLVDADHLRFDFSHFQKVTNEELRQIESIVNKHIRLNIPLDEKRSLPISEAKQMGALAFFGEKYDDEVRVIKFGDSVELCGGTHVDATGRIGLFKIVSEGAIAAGIRRIEAITADKAEEFINNQVDIITELKKMFKNQKNIVKGVENLFAEYNQLQKEINQLKKEKVIQIEDRLKKELHKLNGVNFLTLRLEEDNALIKDIAFSMLMNIENLFLLIGSVSKNKAFLTLAITQDLIENRSFNAGNIIKDLATEINGSGGGQPHFATAGGNNVKGLDKAFLKARDLILSQV
jgi:alanyl-tRNA synthetase